MLNKCQQVKEQLQEQPVLHVQHPATTTVEGTEASAKPVTAVTTAQMMTELGDYQNDVMKEFANSLNHVLHHASMIQRSLDRQSKLLIFENPTEALNVFEDADIGL